MKKMEEFQSLINNPPPGPIEIAKGIVVTDPEKMIKGHLAMLKTYSGNFRFMPYYLRLKSLYEHTQRK